MEQFVLAREGCFAAALLLLVTDSNRALDMPPGKYRFRAEEDGPWIESNGKVGVRAGARAGEFG
jgi:hypothetical protein